MEEKGEMDMHKQESRKSSRIQLSNTNQIQFSLFDEKNNQGSSYCICTDLSESGAHFFTDIQLVSEQKLFLTVLQNGHCIERIQVSVIWSDSGLNDEERFCGAVRFHETFSIFNQLTNKMVNGTSLIAAA